MKIPVKNLVPLSIFRRAGWAAIGVWVMICLFAGNLLAADVPGDFSAANKFYAEGKFAAAATAYESILHSGKVSANLWFNYGNAEFKAGNDAAAKELSSRFMITATELQTTRSLPLDQKFFHQLVAELQAKPLVVAGWSISEPYLRDVIQDPLAKLLPAGKKEDLSIVDLNFNEHGHKEITGCYRLTKDDVFFQVTKSHDGFDLDDLFLWLQAKYCLDQLIDAAPELATDLKKINDEYTLSLDDSFLVDWADMFLPAWTRLCWRSKVVDCAGYQPHKLNLDRRNEHIPWRIPKNLPRPDLRAAAKLLAVLFLDKTKWDLKKLPGGLFDISDGRLIIPIPAWGQFGDLAGLKPLIDGWAS